MRNPPIAQWHLSRHHPAFYLTGSLRDGQLLFTISGQDVIFREGDTVEIELAHSGDITILRLNRL